MYLLIKESPFQVLSSLVMQAGLNVAILLQQIHFRSLISTHVRDGHKWVYKTYDEWKQEGFPFALYNRMKMDKTKWFRIDYEKLQFPTGQFAPSTIASSAQEGVQVAPSTEGNLPLAITKKNKSIKKELVENELDVVSVIAHLNNKANKQFNA